MNDHRMKAKSQTQDRLKNRERCDALEPIYNSSSSSEIVNSPSWVFPVKAYQQEGEASEKFWEDG